MPSRTVSNRKRTILGSRKLHRLYKTIMANKKLSIAIMAIVAPLVGLLVTSKGLPTNYFVGLRKMLTATPFGEKIAEWLQQLVDAILRMLGIGIRVGDVVKVRESCEGNTYLEAKSVGNYPVKNKNYEELMMKSEFIVYRIRKRTVQLIEIGEPNEQMKAIHRKLYGYDGNLKNAEHLTKEEVKEMSFDTAKGYPLLLNCIFYMGDEEHDIPKRPNPNVPFCFPIDDFEKTSDTQLASH